MERYIVKAKTIKAYDSLIAALEELKDALSAEATKSGSAADDEDPGEVPRRGRPAKAASVPAAGKKSRAVPDDDDDVDGDTDDDSEDDDLPPAKPAVAKGKPAAKTAAKPAAKTAAKKGGASLDTVKEKLTDVMNEESLGKARVLKILKKHGAARSADLAEEDYAAVIKACDAAMAEVASADDDGEDDDI